MSAVVSRPGIVVGVDGSPFSKAAVWWVARDAAMCDVALTVVHVFTAPVLGWSATPVPVHLGQWQDEHATTIIADAITIAQESTGHSGALHVNGEVIVSATVPTLVELSTQAQMVVVGCRGRGAFHRRVLGSVSFGLVREAHCPVAVIHDEYPAIPQRGQAPVLVGTDGSTASESATAIAFEEASRRGVQLAAMYAWCDVGAEAMPAVDWPALQTLEDKILAEHLAGWQRQPTLGKRA